MATADTKPRVLIVDDTEANIVALEAILESVDCQVVRAGSGNEALRELLRNEFALVLLDVQMPEMDGFEVARLARSNPRSRALPIIFVTAMLETTESVFAGYESGAVDVLFKPINPHILISKVRVFLELHRSRQKLAAEIDAHQQTLADLEAFNYSVTHDLRGPLRTLAGFSKILIEDYGPALDGQGTRLLQRIASAAERMDQLIADLLRLSQIGRMQPAMKSFDLAAIAREIVGELRLAEPERTVNVVIPDTLPAMGDAGLVRIALENLLRNAWKFTRHTAEPEIVVAATTTRDRTVFSIRDNGAGFDSSKAANLFTPFQRLHTKEQFEGTGIGLAIVHRIVRHHRGKIWAEAIPAKGATFFFTLA